MRRSKEQWLELIAEQESSNLTAVEFCKHKGIDPKYFSVMKCKLRQKSENSRVVDNGASFVKLQSTLPPSVVLEVGNARLTIPAGCDLVWLAGLMKAIA